MHRDTRTRRCQPIATYRSLNSSTTYHPLIPENWRVLYYESAELDDDRPATHACSTVHERPCNRHPPYTHACACAQHTTLSPRTVHSICQASALRYIAAARCDVERRVAVLRRRDAHRSMHGGQRPVKRRQRRRRRRCARQELWTHPDLRRFEHVYTTLLLQQGRCRCALPASRSVH